MTALQDLLKAHRDPDGIDFSMLWEKSLFVFDSNVLLDLYRLPAGARDDLIGVLRSDQLRDRIWIGFQVIVEFLSNRHSTLSEQRSKFNDLRSVLRAARSDYENAYLDLSKKIMNLQLDKRHSLISPDDFMRSDVFPSITSKIDGFMAELDSLEKKLPEVNEPDPIKDIVLELFDGRIGDGFDSHELDAIYKEGDSRYKAEVPPGFKDKAKSGSYFVNDREHVRKFGDLVLWKEIIRKASSSGLNAIVLVTGDVKEDWWIIKSGKRLGPRKELLNEIYTKAPSVDQFYMYDTARFLQQAKIHLEASVSDSSIADAKSLVESDRVQRVTGEVSSPTSIAGMIWLIAASYPSLKFSLHPSVAGLDPVDIDGKVLYDVFSEIINNAVVHQDSPDLPLNVYATSRSGEVHLHFQSVRKTPPFIVDTENRLSPSQHLRNAGLVGVRDALAPFGIWVRPFVSGADFVLQIGIPVSLFAKASIF